MQKVVSCGAGTFRRPPLSAEGVVESLAFFALLQKSRSVATGALRRQALLELGEGVREVTRELEAEAPTVRVTFRRETFFPAFRGSFPQNFTELVSLYSESLWWGAVVESSKRPELKHFLPRAALELSCLIL